MSQSKKTTKAGRGRPAITDAKRQRMRSEIADVAKTLFEEEGYATISMRRIASEIGCAPMTLYKYYDAKIDILRTLWDDVFKDLFDHLEAYSGPDLQSLGVGYVTFWLDNTESYRLVFMADGVTQPDVSIFIDNPALEQRFGLMSEAISDACSTDLAPGELKLKLDAFICFLNGISHNLITISGYAWSEPDEMVEMAVRAVSQ